jgi:hypothetical protein
LTTSTAPPTTSIPQATGEDVERANATGRQPVVFIHGRGVDLSNDHPESFFADKTVEQTPTTTAR